MRRGPFRSLRMEPEPTSLLPDMDKLTHSERRRALESVRVLADLRRTGGCTEEEIAHELGFGNPEAMRIQLRNWELPGWLVEDGSKQPSSAQRRARGGEGSTQELPPASQAAEDFEEVISELDSAVSSLQFLKQWLKDGRFTTEAIYAKESGAANMVYRREDFPDPGGEVGLYWESVCEQHGQDPAVEEFKVPVDKTQYGGAAWYPHDVLTRLIGSYALSGRPLDQLLEKLHPGFTTADRDAAEEKRDEVLHKARQLAAMVRGNRQATKQGPKRVPVRPDEQIQALCNPSTLQRLGIDREEVERITSLRLPHYKFKP
jgi:hypothetical protein